MQLKTHIFNNKICHYLQPIDVIFAAVGFYFVCLFDFLYLKNFVLVSALIGYFLILTCDPRWNLMQKAVFKEIVLF